jgi:hypothetical protein
MLYLTSVFGFLILIFYILILIPNQWGDKDAYKQTLLKLAGLFKKNFEVFTDYNIGEDGSLTEQILAAGPTC